MTAGGNLAFMNAALAITDPGDEVIFPAPFYFNHEMAVMMAGARPVPVPTTREYQLDVDAIARAIGDRTRAVVTVSPNNPTGAVYPEESLRAVNALCRERGVFHVHDEAYEYFTYDKTPHFSPGSIDGASAYTISLFSMSKAYGMASWRVGYMVIPESLWDAINKIQDTLLICAPVVSQVAAVAALGVGRAYAASKIGPLARDASDDRERARRSGGPVHRALRPRAPSTSSSACSRPYQSLDLTERLIREHRVAVVPGSAFGGDECSIRVSYGALDPVVCRRRRAAAGPRTSGACRAREGSHLERQRHPRPPARSGRTSSRPSSRTSCAFRRSRRRRTRCRRCMVAATGYWCFWHGASGYSGVALLVRHGFFTEPTGLPSSVL